MYRKDLYSNTSDSSRNRGGSWVYINGELYHAGVLGMKWGKHLPGTDWWKETTNKYYSQHPNIQSVQGGRQYAAKPTLSTKIKANLSTAGQAAKAYGRIIGSTARTYRDKAIMKAYQAKRAITGKVNNASYKVKKGIRNAWTSTKNGTSRLYNAAKGYSSEKINQLKESARNHYQGVKTKVHGVLDKQHGTAMEIYNNPYLLLSKKGDGKNYLNDWVMSDGFKSVGKYSDAVANGPMGNMLNSLMFDTKMNTKAAVAKLLDRFGLDDEVDALMKKWSNKGKK